jgi:hypothetical protein
LGAARPARPLKKKAAGASQQLFSLFARLNNLFAFIISTVRTELMLRPQIMALRTLCKIRRDQFIHRPAPADARF